jgi:hypothetical protein
MKMLKSFTFIILFVGASLSAQSISNHALGLRLGDSDGFGAEISYQKSLTNTNRIQIDLGWRDSRNFSAFKLAGLYQWVRPIEGDFNWYYGVGGGLGSVDFSNISNNNDSGGVFIFGAGTIGIEYDFDIPLVVSLDFRPELGLIGYDGFDFDIGLGIRYQF